jgi:hypothetical protein
MVCQLKNSERKALQAVFQCTKTSLPVENCEKRAESTPERERYTITATNQHYSNLMKNVLNNINDFKINFNL